MTKYNLHISMEQPNNWFAYADIEDLDGPSKYVIAGSSLAEIRQLVKEGVDGDLGITGIEFEEIFQPIEISST